MDGHKARVGSRVIGGRGFLKPEKPESVPLAVPQTDNLCPAERAFGKLLG